MKIYSHEFRAWIKSGRWVHCHDVMCEAMQIKCLCSCYGCLRAGQPVEPSVLEAILADAEHEARMEGR